MIENDWQELVLPNLYECEMCGDPICEIHDAHYSECECIGLSNDEYEYVEIHGRIFARKNLRKCE
jgi:hypothetical protein